MKTSHCKIRFLFLLLILLAALSGCGGKHGGIVHQDGNAIITQNGVTVTVNETSGLVQKIENADQTIELDGIVIDAGIQEAFVMNQLGYTSFEHLSTWELPVLWPKMKEINPYTLNSIRKTDNGFDVSITVGNITILYHYGIMTDALSLSAELLTTSEEKLLLNGVGFLVQGIRGFDLSETTFRFPGCTPAGLRSCSDYTRYKAAVSDYSAPVIQYAQGDQYLNVLFVDETEKWTTGYYSDADQNICTAFLPCVEGYLSRDTKQEIGTLYLQLLSPDEDALTAVSEFWTELGYHPPADGAADAAGGGIYSGHPYGTMDTDYFNRLTLQEYTSEIDSIAAMGFTGIWLMPIFEHTGDNVYEPIDQGIIDARYGGEEGAAQFIAKAHEKGLRVLFDVVPHGPRPTYPFAKEHDDWISKDKNGENQIEWECVSFDYNNPGYYDYTAALMKNYAETIGLDGARIDCSMGGLSNWSSPAGLRASASGFAAGINITRAIRQGFTDAGTAPLLLPENFHPNPAYAEYTDIFYDMPLYRCLYDLNQSGCDMTSYVSTLTSFLDAEHKTGVAGQVKLRFLGNHDTVTWTYDAMRAQSLYGTERAKALWMMLGWIDGSLYIYQGDEDPATYGLSGENLEDFFADVLHAKAQYLPSGDTISYLQTGSPVFAFYRSSAEEADRKLVLINMSDQEQTFTAELTAPQQLHAIGQISIDGSQITLAPYAGVILR